MARTDEQRDKIARQFVDVAFEDAIEIRDELYGEDGLFERRRANREQLRSLAAQGYLSEDQTEVLNDLYPPRQRGEEDEEVEPEPEQQEAA